MGGKSNCRSDWRSSFSGVYAIRKNEKIYDLINRAGGLTKDAFSHGAVFTRKSLAEREDQQTEN